MRLPLICWMTLWAVAAAKVHPERRQLDLRLKAELTSLAGGESKSLAKGKLISLTDGTILKCPIVSHDEVKVQLIPACCEMPLVTEDLSRSDHLRPGLVNCFNSKTAPPLIFRSTRATYFKFYCRRRDR